MNICAVGGLITPSVMCGLIIEGTKQCGSEIGCVFQKKQQTEVKAVVSYPTGSLGEEVMDSGEGKA